MSFGPLTVFTKTMASGGDTAVFTIPKAYSKMFLYISSLSTNAEVGILGSTDGTNFYKFKRNSMTSNPTALCAGSACNNSIVPIMNALAPYIQMKCTAVVSGGGVFKLICHD